MKIFILITLILVFSYAYFLFTQKQIKNIKKGKFENKWADRIYRHSFSKPLYFFSDKDDDLSEKGIELEERLKKIGWNKYFTVQSFTALNAMLFIVNSVVAFLVLYFLYNINDFLIRLGVIKEAVFSLSPVQSFMIISFFMLVTLYPKSMIKQRYKKVLVEESKEFPVLQMFVILMLKSNKTVSEILYALSQLNTHHKKTFVRGYRIYLRNSEEAFEYYRKEFSHSKFSLLFDILGDLEMYSWEDTIRILENSMEFLVEETQDVQRKNDLTRLVYSQMSMAVPFAVVLIMGVSPIIYMVWGELKKITEIF